VREIFFKSRAIVDIHHPKQRGLTMRTIEALGSKRKLITTNPSVRSYDFYCPQNIHILEDHGESLTPEFFRTPYVEVSERVYHKYSLDGWLDSVFA
jgi:hypothetical protein